MSELNKDAFEWGKQLSFGSEETKEMLLYMSDGGNSKYMLSAIYGIVHNYVQKKLKNGSFYVKTKDKTISIPNITPEDIEYVTDDVFERVSKSIYGFIEKINDYNERSRNAWLKTILYRSFANYCEKSVLNRTAIRLDADIDMEEGELQIDIPYEDRSFNIVGMEECIKKAIRIVSEVRREAKMKIAFYYNTIIFIDKKKKSAITTCETCNQQQLFYLKEKFINVFDQGGTSVIQIEREDVHRLNEEIGDIKAKPKGEELFISDAKKVADWSNKVRQSLLVERAKKNNGNKGVDYLWK